MCSEISVKNFYSFGWPKKCDTRTCVQSDNHIALTGAQTDRRASTQTGRIYSPWAVAWCHKMFLLWKSPENTPSVNMKVSFLTAAVSTDCFHFTGDMKYLIFTPASSVPLCWEVLKIGPRNFRNWFFFLLFPSERILKIRKRTWALSLHQCSLQQLLLNVSR